MRVRLSLSVGRWLYVRVAERLDELWAVVVLIETLQPALCRHIMCSIRNQRDFETILNLLLLLLLLSGWIIK